MIGIGHKKTGTDELSAASRRYLGPLPKAGGWARLEALASLVGLEGKVLDGMDFVLYDGQAYWDRAGKTMTGEQVWVEDALPYNATGYIGDGAEAWNWVSSPVYSGGSAHQSTSGPGRHSHYFMGAWDWLTVGPSDTLFVYTKLDTANPPTEVQVKWRSYHDLSWAQTAYWGPNYPSANFTSPGFNLGLIPPAGHWNAVVGGETRYIYDGMLVVQERDGNNTPTVTYTRGVDLSGGLSAAGGIGGLLARSEGYVAANGAWLNHDVYHSDGNGNIGYVARVGANGYIQQATYRYDPYGNLTSGGGSANKMRYSSKLWMGNNGSDTAGLYYYGYRFYEPGTQRWLNRDPIAEIGGINLYGFLGNSPINNIDLLGLLMPDRFREVVDRGVPCGFDSAGVVAGKDGTPTCLPEKGLPDCSADLFQLVSMLTGTAPAGVATAGMVSVGRGASARCLTQCLEKTAAKEGFQFTKSSLKLGQEVHKAYKAGLTDGVNTFKEFSKIKGIRPDFVDFTTKTIYELKPNNPRGILEGLKQLDRYKSAFEETYGPGWKTVLDPY